MGLISRMSLAALAAAFFLGPVTSARESPIQRPSLKPWPHHPSRPFPHSSPRSRHKTCFVPSKSRGCSAGGGQDDAPDILAAFHECNHGGTVVLDQDYTIGSPLDLTFLEEVDVAITGTLSWTTDIDYWVAHAFNYTYQTQSTWLRFGGRDVNVYGGGRGELNGNGQVWFDAFSTDPTLVRPILMVLDGLDGGSVSGLHMRNSPEWFNLIANSSDVLVSDMSLYVASTNSSVSASNGDGWDIYRSDNIVIQDSYIDNTDDCVSFKPNATNILIQGLYCTGSHGISVGSLGQYPAEYDIVENIYVYNISMNDASDGARIKVWPGISTPFQPSLSGGGGAGYVKNVTYDLLHNNNNDYAIEIDQCYGQSNQTLCNMYPSNMTISDVLFKDFSGVTSTTYDPEVGTLVCSSTASCTNIRAKDIHVKPPSGKKPEWICTNMNDALLHINCVNGTTPS